MGEPTYEEYVPCTESIGVWREPGELKHLSSRRKRKKAIDFLSSGERKGKSPNLSACAQGLGPQKVFVSIVERTWKDRRKRVKAPYTKCEQSQRDPEYIKTRGTLMERAGTTP